MRVERSGWQDDDGRAEARGPERGVSLREAWAQAGHRMMPMQGAARAVAFPLPRAIPVRLVRVQPPLRDARLPPRRRGNRGLFAGLALASLALTAACGSLVTPAPEAARSVRSEAASPPAPKVAARIAAAEPAPRPAPAPVAEAPRAEPVLPPDRPEPRRAPAPQEALSARTALVAFDAAPFPYDGLVPGRGRFLDVAEDGRRGHRTARGGVLWEEQTFGDNRVLLHVPPGFDPGKPATLVVFFHGHGATLSRDVLARQQVPAQVTASGANAVLVAPQFAVDARDSSAGRFWEPGGFSRFLAEAASHLAQAAGTPDRTRAFATMPVVIVAYSGGFAPAAWSLKDQGAGARIRGVVLLDALYGELDTYADWATGSRDRFLVSAYTRFTQARNGELERVLARRGLPTGRTLPDRLTTGATFLPTGPEANHADYVTQAWTEEPLADILRRLPDGARGTPVAALDEPRRERRAGIAPQ
ncbi:hypothetical protein [Methylobacterium nonmethylotrophicum]|uniref:hypothetical protein n=1 Tax=Methylobacterium nonmethylotrophicum TaxID=1141884 RepID=UPI00197C376A|nr:hypothetical protein [Methylobacterium nonmethylotrophicum]